MAQAMVQMSCAKLRSAIAIGDDGTGGLKEMMEALVAIQPFLENAERRSVLMRPSGMDLPYEFFPPTEMEVQEWLRRVIDNAYNICDMMDYLQDTRRTSPLPAATLITSVIRRRENVPRKDNPMADKMEKMNEELRNLWEELLKFDLKPSYSDLSVQRIIDVPVAEVEEEAVGVGSYVEVQRIIAEIIARDASEGPIIASIGRGDGSGKTTVARMIFNHTQFKHYARVWIHYSVGVSGLHEIGKSIISQVSGEKMGHHGSNDDMESITKRLHELLNNGMKMLVVIEELDLRKDYSIQLEEYYIQLKRMLSVADKGSRVVVIQTTSRYASPEHFTVPPLELKPLSDEDCWTILKQRSHFEDRPESEKQELERIGVRAIAEKCRSLPLAAASLGGMLRYKDAKGWEEALNSDLWEEQFSRNPSFINLVYISMPPSLRLCFAYCAIFPGGCSMAKDDLIHQWVALGLLEPSDRFSATQLGEHHFRMLLVMSLLRTTKSASANGKDDKGTVLFTMNDTVHRFARELIHDKLIDRMSMYRSRLEELVSNKVCRYACLTNFDDGPLNLSSILPAQLRAIRFEDCSRVELNDDSFSSTRWLGVLEMKKHSMQKLPHSICQLRHLGYLNLSGCSGLENLPESFGDLLNLLHIDLSGCFGLVNLPESFGKLKKLVHINLAGCSRLVNLPELFGKLTNLVHIDLSGCSGLINLPKLFRKLTNLVYIDLSSCSRLQKLPQSFGKLINLEHIDLSECSGLVNLPRSFGKLIKVPHINLSGCSALVNLPESFGELINLVHIDLSGCSRLVTLPVSFGDLTDLVYINLSRCHGLVNLPQSFRKLEKLEHLDLSFWSSFKVIQTALAGRSNLQHLNLSHPCCSLAQHRPHPEGLKEVLGQLTSLKYLNLSMLLNPICDSQSEEKIREYIQCISGVSSLEHLDLSHNMFLREVPECLGELNKLHTLDLSGCIRLESIDKRIGEMKSLKLIFVRNCRRLKSYQVVVQAVDDGAADSSTNLVQLEDADFEELEISCLEKVKSREDVQRVRLAAKRKLEKLKLCWTEGSHRSVEDNALLGDLVPPHNLQCLELHGYYGQGPACLCDMAWWAPTVSPNLLNLAEVTIDNVWTCNQLPPLGLLPNLQRLALRRMPSITTIHGYHLSGGNRAALNRLTKFTIEYMDNLHSFYTIYYGAGGEELMFPDIDELVIQTCPLLVFSPLPPRARMMAISDCKKVMSASWWTGGGRGVEGPRTSALVTELVVDFCSVMLNQWHVLHHLPGLRSLTIKNCLNLDISPEIIQALSSLQTLCFSDCICSDMTSVLNHIGALNSLRELQIARCRLFSDFPDSMQKLTSLESMHLSRCPCLEVLPEWLGDITSLQKLTIDTCHSMESLPQSILTNLKDLQISNCRSLKRWFEQEENKKLLAHIPNKTYKD